MTGMIDTLNTRVIAADPDLVFSLAANVTDWPEILPHYRYVRVLAGTDHRRTVAMGAARSGVPVRWTAIQEVNHSRLEILYRHVGGVTTGMDVVWTIEPLEAGARATITHRLRPERWWLRYGLTQWIVGTLFVMNIADRTLAGIGRHAELESR
jgi:ribosome-associated toxin RatA of RatAB toxin-antitoxin module